MLLGSGRPLWVDRGSSGEEGADGSGCSRGRSRFDRAATDDGVQDVQETTAEDSCEMRLREGRRLRR
jgi:hypothetical protein